MGVILDSSIVVRAERQRVPVKSLLKDILTITKDQNAALSAVGLTELIHGLYRASTPEIRLRRQNFLDELMRDVTVYPFTKETAMLAGRVDGEQRERGIVVPFPDLLIGATALHLGYAVLTANERHFRLIPELQVLVI
ncbi:MAG TPA: PIN domain-containing protein [Acidobacteriaceae bacterium]